MSITPLDLQTLFVRQNEVSKEQSHNQHASALQQSLEAKKLVEQELKQGSSVGKTPEDKETSKVDDQEEKKQQEEKKFSGSKENKEDPKKEVVQDPEMGTHIDISG
ncbi:hypothetical protein [Oceanispirochaeta sp.]|jgi:hypothetical protein|uniref:hypothetical protein n=1 Tax=Oceanispirochaeta sp. TaxID=2035350 RepID=UPI0026045037|nr:hypothetical protein [Oceanispirochaeta sp.]MDA3957842.1 hypothetical protein [Oceanispirochaeta sp.]